MGKKRVLAVSHSLHYDGAPQSMLQIISALDPQEFEIFLLAAEGGGLEKEYERLGAKVLAIDETLLPDQVWTPDIENNTSQRLATYARVIDAHNIDALFANTRLMYLAIHAAAIKGIPSVWSIRESIDSIDELCESERQAFALASRVVFCSDTTRRIYQPLANGNYLTAYNGIDAEKIKRWNARVDQATLRRQLDLPVDKLIVSIIGTPTPRKGHHLFVRMAAELARSHPELHFAIVGIPEKQYPYMDELLEFIERQQLLDVFSLVKRTKEIFNYYAATDIIAFPSYNESFPRVILEAMAFSRGIVAFDAWGVHEQLSDGEHGLLAPVGDSEAFKRQLCRLISDPELRQRLGAAAYRRVVETFSIAKMTEPYQKLLAELTTPQSENGRKQGVDFKAIETLVSLLESKKDEAGKRALSLIESTIEDQQEFLTLVQSLRRYIRARMEQRKLPIYRELQEWADAPGRRSMNLLLQALAKSAGIRLARAGRILDGLPWRNQELMRLNFDAIFAERTFLAESTINRCSVTGGHFRHITGQDSNWTSSRLRRIQFIGGNLNQAAFTGSDMKGAFFSGTFLIRAEFRDCDLSNAVFKHCWMGECRFIDCDLSNTRFDHSLMERVSFENCNTTSATFQMCNYRQTDIELVSPPEPGPQMADPGKPHISLLTISRNLDNLRRLITSLRNSNHQSPVDIHCAWNGSDDPSILLEEFEDLAVQFHTIVPYNFASNNNQLADSAEGQYLLFINDDVELDTDCLRAASHHLRHRDVGIIGANLRYPNGKIQHAGAMFRDDGTPFHRYRNLLRYDDSIIGQAELVPAVTGAFILMRSDEFRQLRFDERFTVSGEDVDLCLRYQARFNRAILYAADARAIHHEGITRKTRGENYLPFEDRQLIRNAFSTYRASGEQ